MSLCVNKKKNIDENAKEYANVLTIDSELSN